MKHRIMVGLLSMSAAAFVARLAHEGYTDGAVIPTKGDVPTVGFGSTVREDGTRVTMSDRTDPVSALKRADPIVAGFNPDNRDPFSLGTIQAPSRNIRLVDIDVARFYCGAMGPQFCAIVRGRCRTYEAAPFAYLYEQGANTPERRANLRFPRGIFLWKSGTLNCPPAPEQYVLITTFRESVFQGVNVVKNGPTGNHALRNSGRDHIWRHSSVSAVVASASLVKHQAGNGQTAWVDGEDSVGSMSGALAWDHRPTSRLVMADMVYHSEPGAVIPDICVGAGAENNDVGYGHGVIEYCAFSNSVSAENTWQSVAGLDVQVNGKGHSTRNVRLANGTYVTQSAGAYENNIPVDMRGPYLYETVDTRPNI